MVQEFQTVATELCSLTSVTWAFARIDMWSVRVPLICMTLIYMSEIVQLEMMCKVAHSNFPRTVHLPVWTVSLHMTGITHHEMALKYHVPEEIGYVKKI